MMLQTGSLLCFRFLFLLCTLPSPTLAYLLKDCIIVYSENVTAAVSVDCEYRQLVSVPDDIPRDVKSLTLKANDIRKINRADFYHLSNLQDLDLSWNAITHVDDGAFVHLVELKELHFDNNNLTTLSDKKFQGLSNLLILSLDENPIQSLSPVAFQLLPSLQELSLNCNQITDIIAILPLPHLQVLNISIYDLVSFQSKDLPLNMSSELRELRVQSASIRMFSITTAVFPHLKTIDLSRCCNDSGWEWDIPDKYFLRNITKVYFSDDSTISFNTIRKSLQSLDSLEYLHLDNMQKWIRDILNIACKIFTLRTLNLPNNENTKNISETLTPCTQLTNLDLSFNDLTELSKGSIKQMKQLSSLNLAWNKFSKVPDDVNNLSMLQMLDLQHNLINDLSCSDLLNLTRLTHLHLDMNEISELKQCVFQPLSELKVLTVNGNAIMTLGDTFKTGLQKLELLDLSKNDLDMLNGDFTSLKLLKHLDLELSDMMWDFTIADFEGLDELETLSIIIHINSDVKLTSSLHHDDFPLLKSLKKLTIQYDGYNPDYTYFYTISALLSCLEHLEHFTAVNVYGQPSEYIIYLPQLKTLTLKSGNLLYVHPEIFYPNLEALHLSNMKLKSLDFLVQANLTRLSWMDLSQNELTVINVSVFLFLPALSYVNMADNLFVCDCSNADFLQWMWENKQTLVAAAHSYMCAYPLGKNGTRLLDFDYHSCWNDSSFICYISSTCVIVLTLLISFTYHFLMLHLIYAYYLFLAFLYDAKERKRGSPQRYDAFISYNVHDELWVYRKMLPVLEGEQGWRLCLHHRDFEPGKAIIENITEAIYGSRKTICVISRHYLQSEWCSREIQMASYRLFDEKKDVLILVFLEDIPAQQLSPYYRMRSLVKRHSYLSWSQAAQHPGLFWQNLRRALDTPHTELGLNE